MSRFESSWQQHDLWRFGALEVAGILGSAATLPAAHFANVQQHRLGPRRVEKTSQRVTPARHMPLVYQADPPREPESAVSAQPRRATFHEFSDISRDLARRLRKSHGRSHLCGQLITSQESSARENSKSETAAACSVRFAFEKRNPRIPAMRNTSVIVLFVLLSGCSSKTDEKRPQGHHQAGDTHKNHDMSKMGNMPGTLVVKTDPSEVKANQPTKLSLMIHDADGAMVKDFDVVHEKRIHLIVVSDGLSQFAHIHPDIDSAGSLTVTYAFPTGGTYRLYADFKPVGKNQTVAMAEVKVLGNPTPAPNLIPNAPGNIAGPELNAKVAIPTAKASEESKITISLLDSMDKPVTDLQPYLGAMGHLVIISADGKHYVHAHAIEGKSINGAVEFAAHFAQAGVYKAWGEFQRAGKVFTVPFVLKFE